MKCSAGGRQRTTGKVHKPSTACTKASDDHSRTCVCARLMVRERTRAVCEGLRAALASYGVPEQILTDTAKCSPAGSTTRWSRCSLSDLPGKRSRPLVGLNPHGIKVRSNRGVAGIDGPASTGDRAMFLHMRGPTRAQPIACKDIKLRSD